MNEELYQQSFLQSQSQTAGNMKYSIIISIVSSLLAAAIVGGVVYAVLQNAYSDTQAQLNNQITTLQNQVNALQQQQQEDDVATPTNVETNTNQNADVAAEEAENNNISSDTAIDTPFQKVRVEGDHPFAQFIYYEGLVTISGTYEEWYPRTLNGGNLCFYPDEETKHLLPAELMLFCFENQEQAKRLFGINDDEIFSDETITHIKGEATIQVSHYVEKNIETEVWDTAYLERIVSKEPYTTHR